MHESNGEVEPASPSCTSTFTGAENNVWGTAANWTGGIPGLSSYGCIPPDFPGSVYFTGVGAPTEIGGVSAENSEGLTLQAGELTLANSDQVSLINNVRPGGTDVTLDEGVVLELTGTTGELGGNVWRGPGALEVPRKATLRTGECLRWGGQREDRCVDGTPTPGRDGLQIRNFGTIYGAGISLCRSGAGLPAKLENEGVLRVVLSGGFDGDSECGADGLVVNGEHGLIGMAQLDGQGCNVRVGFPSLVNRGEIKIGPCGTPESEEVRRATLEVGSSFSEAGTIVDAGIVQVDGNYSPTGSSNLIVSIRQTFPPGSAETNFGAVKVSGDANIGGELNVETDRFMDRPPVLGERFEIVEAGGSLGGEFTLGQHCIASEPGNGYAVDYRPGSKGNITLEVAKVPGC